MKDWSEWSIWRHFNVAWRWALVAVLLLIAPIETIMQYRGAPVSISWIPRKFPQGSYWDGPALSLIVFLSYLTVGIVSKQVEKEQEESYKSSMEAGLVLGFILSLIGLCIAFNPQNHSRLTAGLTFFGLLYALFLGLAVGSVVPEKKLGEGATFFAAFFLSCGLTTILALGVVVGPIPLLIIEAGLLLVVAASFGLTKFIRFLNQRSVLSRIGRWLIAG